VGLFRKVVGAEIGKISPPEAIGGEGRTGGSVGVPLQFAFVDVETTGLEPWKDRVIEIAVVITDGLGVLIDEWCTLVNPGTGDAGPTRIHLIESSWLPAAPTFSDIAGDIAVRLSGRVLVCHKSDFDADFLEAEFERAGHPIEDLKIPTLDTLTLANTVGLPRALQKACQQLGYYYDSHNAMDDAIACAELFHRLAPVINPTTFSGVSGVPVDIGVKASGMVVKRDEAALAVKPRSILAEFTQYLYAHDPHVARDNASLRQYGELVISALEDGYIDASEQHAIASAAHHLHLSAVEIADLHHEIVLGMIDCALEDRRISKAERAEIDRAAAWLGVDLADWDVLVKAARKRVKTKRDEFAASVSGKTIVFTGQGVHPNNIREALAMKHGMVPQKSFSQQTDFVVIGAADLDTKTVQAARDAGTAIVVESLFWQRLGEA
jgi:DNA polymerase-3 subunit epsilon